MMGISCDGRDTYTTRLTERGCIREKGGLITVCMDMVASKAVSWLLFVLFFFKNGRETLDSNIVGACAMQAGDSKRPRMRPGQFIHVM